MMLKLNKRIKSQLIFNNNNKFKYKHKHNKFKFNNNNKVLLLTKNNSNRVLINYQKICLKITKQQIQPKLAALINSKIYICQLKMLDLLINNLKNYTCSA